MKSEPLKYWCLQNKNKNKWKSPKRGSPPLDFSLFSPIEGDSPSEGSVLSRWREIDDKIEVEHVQRFISCAESRMHYGTFEADIYENVMYSYMDLQVSKNVKNSSKIIEFDESRKGNREKLKKI